MRESCSLCNLLLVAPVGPRDSRILLIGDFPGWEESRQGYAWVGKGGDVLRQELARAGVQFEMCRATNLWRHKVMKDPDEFRLHMEACIEEAKDKEYILLMGQEVCNAFLSANLSEVMGLSVNSPYLPRYAKIVACKNPATVTHAGATIGDLRDTVKFFGRLVNDG